MYVLVHCCTHDSALTGSNVTSSPRSLRSSTTRGSALLNSLMLARWDLVVLPAISMLETTWRRVRGPEAVGGCGWEDG